MLSAHTIQFKLTKVPKLKPQYVNRSVYTNVFQLLTDQPLPQASLNDYLCESWTFDILKRHFEAAIDAENALHLRQSAVLTDIGICLEILTAKLSIYDLDNATSSYIKDDIESLKRACAARELKFNYTSLANLRSIVPPYHLSFREKHQNLYWEVRQHDARRRDAKAAALNYLQDPLALREYRLGKVSAAARSSRL